MSEQQDQPPFAPPVSVFTGPVAELIAATDAVAAATAGFAGHAGSF